MKRIGILPNLYAQPLFYGLDNRAGPVTFEPVLSPHAGTAHLAIQLRQAQLHGAFLSPIDYARDCSAYSILPRVGVVSEGESRSVLLLFRERARKIATIAADPSSISEIVLAHLVLAEKYDTIPTVVPFSGSIDQALEKADAVLCFGDVAYDLRERKNTLDLVDEWKDITDLPYVHGFWVIRENALTPAEVNAVVETSRQGVSKLDEIAPDGEYLKRFSYDLTEEAFSALGEFFRMAYYHGILKDIPEVKVYRLEGEQHSTKASMN